MDGEKMRNGYQQMLRPVQQWNVGPEVNEAVEGVRK
jgi:hypothetical protein